MKKMTSSVIQFAISKDMFTPSTLGSASSPRPQPKADVLITEH